MGEIFRYPLWLFGAALFILGAAALDSWASARRRRLLAAFGDLPILSRLIPASAEQRRGRKFLCQTAGIALIFAALAGPQWGVELVTAESRGVQAVVAVDTSLSMAAEDMKPSRMEKAKSELSQILDGLKGQRVGLIAFAGEAHVQCPLTTDLGAAKQFLSYVRVGMVPQPGTAIGEAVRLAARMLAKYPGQKALVLLTDGEDRGGNPLAAAKEAAEAGIRIFVIGIGSPEGEPIPIKDAQGRVTAYVKDKNGSTVISKLGEQEAVQIAAAGSGAYFRATPDEGEVQEIVRRVNSLDKSAIQSGSSSRYLNRFQIPLALALLLLIAEILTPEKTPGGPRAPAGRSAAPALLLLLAAPFLSGCAASGSAADVWRGNRAYNSESFDKALEKYARALKRTPADPQPVFNAGDAQYKLGRFDDAGKAFSNLTDAGKSPKNLLPKAFYNLGNSHFKKEEYKEAAEAYKRCLLLDPKDEDCRYNLAKLLAMTKNPSSRKNREKQKNESGGKNKPEQPDRPRPQSGMSQEDARRLMQAVREAQKNIPQPKPAWQKAQQSQEEVDW